MNNEVNYAQIVRERILPYVQKPARYIGQEWNQVVKDPAQVNTRIALAFPDVYEIGISYLGFHILYELLNQSEDVYAERVYSPWTDAEALLRELAIPLVSVETCTPLAVFHIVGITLQHEMSYTNVVNLLDLAQLPLEAKDRGEDDPLIIGGGPCTANPEPLAPLFDLLVLGDGEDVFLELVKEEQALRPLPRQERIRKLGQIPGVYAPAFYTPRYVGDNRLDKIEAAPGMPVPVKRRIAQAPALPQRPLVPYLGITHDRVSTELFRGCTRGCRFCQAGMINRPVRERDPEAVIEQLSRAVKNTGYEEVSVTSLSSGDYTQLIPFVKSLMAVLLPDQVALSFPSLRLDSFRNELAETVRMVRKTGLTFAPEAGSARLRQVINKCLDEEGFTQNLANVFAEGWDLVKLYFMIGLPTETDEDVQEINRLVRRILREAKQQGTHKRAPRLNLSINLYVPKAHTPFQWEPQLSRELAKQRLQTLAEALPKATGYRFGKRTEEELNRSYLEGVLARGDRRLWPVIHRAWAKGARFDSWGDCFHFELWEQAFAELEINADDYVLRRRSLDEVLPWQHLDLGVSLQYLKQEWQHSQEGMVTADCRQTGNCNGCGAYDPKDCPLPDASALSNVHDLLEPAARPEREMVRIRLSYTKGRDIRFVGHLDLVNLFRRAAKRAGLPLHYSRGFHPQPSLSFGPPLSLGMEGRQEWMDMGLDSWADPKELLERLNQKLPEGVRILSAREVPLRTPSLNEQINAGEYEIIFKRKPGVQEHLEAKLHALSGEQPVLAMQRSKKGMKEVDLKPAIAGLSMIGNEEDRIVLRLVHRTTMPQPAKVPAIIEFLKGDLDLTVRCVRTSSGKWYDNTIVMP